MVDLLVYTNHRMGDMYYNNYRWSCFCSYFNVPSLALYCPGSTAVQKAVQFCCCLCWLLWRLGSYIGPKLSSYSHIRPFLRYLWSKGRLSEPSGKGRSVDPPTDHPDQKSFFLAPFLAPFFFLHTVPICRCVRYPCNTHASWEPIWATRKTNHQGNWTKTCVAIKNPACWDDFWLFFVVTSVDLQ